jgi:hypothetical protein
MSSVGYYAGLRRESRKAFLLGPYATRAEAEAVLAQAHERAIEIDPFCHFDEPGIFRLESPQLPEGRLNHVLGVYNGA